MTHPCPIVITLPTTLPTHTFVHTYKCMYMYVDVHVHVHNIYTVWAYIVCNSRDVRYQAPLFLVYIEKIRKPGDEVKKMYALFQHKYTYCADSA